MLGFTKIQYDVGTEKPSRTQERQPGETLAAILTFAIIVGLFALGIGIKLWIFLPRFFLN
ncbi:MAG TPA: hypothetical protein VFB08_07825 [Burkholderiales bacterium]|nr:hypothetical protein [Burkholderiales bacterium]